MTKPRKHKYVTQCINAGQTMLTVWPDPHEVANDSLKAKYLASIEKINNDPRVVGVEESKKFDLGFVFTIDPNAS